MRSARTTQRVKLSAIANEAAASLLQRPGRSALTMIGTVLGIGAFVTVLGVTTTANNQVTSSFTHQAATELRVTSTAIEATAPGARRASVFPEDAVERLSRLNGITSSAVVSSFSIRGQVSKFPSAGGGEVVEADIRGVSDSYWRTVHAHFHVGRPADGGLRTQPVAILSQRFANRLGLSELATRPQVYLDGTPFTVVGIISGTDRDPDAISSVTVPMAAAQARWGQPNGPTTMIVETEIGAAAQAAQEIPYALDPYRPASFQAAAPASPHVVQNRISDDLQTMFLVLAAVCLVVGAVGIANTTLVAVLERVSEIGLRRALGARRHQILVQVLLESSILGAFGGLLGMLVGMLVVLGVATGNGWTAVVPPWILVAGPFGGLVTGVLAGLYPAAKASNVEPIVALNRL